MFDHNRRDPRGQHGFGGHHGPRHRRGGMRQDAANDMHAELRAELRRNLRRGAGPGGPGPDFSFRDMFGGRRSGFVRRGEIRGLVLAALRDRPMHGYEVIQELESQSEGRWRPSAGSVYPTLQQLADEGLVTGNEVDGRRTYTLTEAGRKAATEAAEASPRSRWTASDASDGDPDLRRYAVELMSASMQVHRMGSPAAKKEVARILGDARKRVYRLLSEDGPADEAETTEPGNAREAGTSGPTPQTD
jgi:DNA-binding PadR family transcriptional regulator